jgi:hypothetical protein
LAEQMTSADEKGERESHFSNRENSAAIIGSVYPPLTIWPRVSVEEVSGVLKSAACSKPLKMQVNHEVNRA